MGIFSLKTFVYLQWKVNNKKPEVILCKMK
nr:MAG TPA: hypothetical protein [Bacteriophage sp.]DAQ77390.1 MAG TPA: hypothetical protein [Caudoviricetes sp.]